MNFYDELKKIMIALAQVEGDSEITSVNVRAGKHMYRINAQCEVEEHMYRINVQCEVEEVD